MKSILFAIIASIVLLQCTPRNNYTPSDLAGNWSLIKVDIIEEKQSIERYYEYEKYMEREIATEQAPLVSLDRNTGILKPYSLDYLSIRMDDVLFSKDSVFTFDYPFEWGKSNSYSIKSDLLKIGTDREGKTIAFSTEKDTMRLSWLDGFGLYWEETYQKAMFKDSLLNILRLYDVNFPLLAGTWEVIREASSNNDGAEYTLDFPYDIPDTILVTRAEILSTLDTDRAYYMLTNGKKRKYFFDYSSSLMGNNEEYFLLNADDWYKSDDPYIHYRRIREEK